MKLNRHARKSKTYKRPQHLTLGATGLLAHAREYTDSNGNFSWGESKTGEFFGLSKDTIGKYYDELAKSLDFEVIQSGRDPKTGKNLLKIVRPRRGPRPRPAPADQADQNPRSQISVESSPTNDESSPTSTVEEKTTLTGNPHYIGSSTEYVETDIKGSIYMSTVVSTITDKRGFPDSPPVPAQPTPPAKPKRNLVALLQEEQAELGFWESTKNIAKADGCRQKITELQSELDAAS
jgi:hypothetical protein